MGDDIEIVVGADPGDPDDVRRDVAVRRMLPWLGGVLAATSLIAAAVAFVEGLMITAAVSIPVSVVLLLLALWAHHDSGRHAEPLVGADLLSCVAVCIAAVPGLVGIVESQHNADWSMTVVVTLAAAGSLMLSLRWLVATLYAVWLSWMVCLAIAPLTFDDMALWIAGGVAATALGVITCMSRRDMTDQLARAEETAALASVRDTLTGLANRRGLSMLGQQMVEVARRQGDAVHCVYVDIDQLAHVNNVAGREAGDEVVVAVADALRSVTRSTDVVARWGGDEFCVVGPGAGMAPMELERRVRERVLMSPPVPDDVWSPRVCAGGAMLAPWDSGTLDTLLGKADQEMYLRRALRRTGPRGRPQRERRRIAGT